MKKDSQQARKPNVEEINQLADYLLRHHGFPNLAEAHSVVSNAYIAVFEHYITGGPCFAGKVMSVVWDGHPGQYEVYTFQNGEIQYIEQGK